MIDRNSQFMAILTNVGAAKLANANALGIPWNLTELGVGDANGTDPMPSATQTKLINEKRRAPLNQLRVDPVNAAVIIAEQVIPADIGGWWIREIGLYDSDGDLVAVSNCAPSFKPALDQGSGRTQIVRMNFIVSSINNIVLKIDPAIVLATREYVDLAITEAIYKQDFKHSVLVATTANIALSGIQTVDGVLLAADARVLVKDQAQAKDNGIYVVPASGAWKRAQDADASIEVTPGLFVSVEKGTVHGDSVWQLVTDAPIILGTTALTFEVVAGRTGVVAGTYRSLTVDKNGRVIAGTNPTTLLGNGITDGATKTDLSEAISGVVAKTGATLSGSLILSNGTNDSPELGWETPTTKAYIDVVNNSVRIFGSVDGGETLIPFDLNLKTKSAYVFGNAVFHTGNFDPATKAEKATTLAGYGINNAYTQAETDNLLRGKAAKATTLGGYGITDGLSIGAGGIGSTVSTPELANAFAVPHGGMWSVSPNTQGVPFSYGSLIHTIYDGGESWTQIAVDMAGGGMYWRGSINGSVQEFKRLLDESNFNPNTKIQAINCPQAGFTDNTTATPFMTHGNGKTVALARADATLGVGQTWQDVTGARVANTNYTNTTSRPIVVSAIPGDALRNELLVTVSGVDVSRMAIASGAVHQAISSVTAIIPPGATYMVSVGSGSISKWSELR